MSQQYIWIDGKFKKFEEVTVPILTHSLQYGSGIFEGIRCYQTKKGPAVFRLKEHMKRFLRSAEIYEMKLGYTLQELCDATVETLRKDKLTSAYIRPFAFYNDQRIGLDVTGKKVSVAIIAIPFGNYFKNKDKGIKCKISSWQRFSSSVLPPEAKASGNYLNSIIASIDAKNSGADEAIIMSSNGDVAEGPGENIFIVNNAKLTTPPREADILMGITRDAIIKIAQNMGLIVEERNIHKEELYTSEEVFFTGTAAEVTGIVSIDSRKIGNGKIGPITTMLASKYAEIISGMDLEFDDWLTYLE